MSPRYCPECRSTYLSRWGSFLVCVGCYWYRRDAIRAVPDPRTPTQ